ncbi:hypothetical protein [Bdellovibrio sp. HCB288]|uniref:hypothetical protein n=1 Tax=Bdellovibrio sp. HCB288 TaxID=3394355 RepID=UPI0039B58BFC
MFNKNPNNKGNAILLVLAAMVVMSISFYYLSTYVIGQRKQVVKTKNTVNLKFAVNSALDYVVFGIRQKYCFENVTLLQNTTSCDWKHAGNVERLVMSDEQLQSLQAMAIAGTNIGPHDPDLEKLRLDKIELSLKFPVSSAHPLFPVVNSLKNVLNEITNTVVPVSSMSVLLTRPSNAGYLPKAGREVYIQAQVSLLDNAGNVIQVGRAPLTVRSQLAVYPREIGSFALVLPGNLRMDKEWNETPPADDKGAVYFHKFNSKGALGESQGLVFTSPVFVNGNINLPNDGGAQGKSAYAGVTFADRVYMGNGWILRPDDTQYAPVTQGGVADRYWSDSRVFGGFLKGIENDGMRDLGLDVLSGRSSGSNGDEFDLNKLCADLNQKSTKFEFMEASDLKATKKNEDKDPPDEDGYYTNYRLTLTNYNTFYAQKNPLPGYVTNGDWSSGSVAVDNKGKETGAIASIEVTYGQDAENKKVIVDLVRDAFITVKLPTLNPALESNLASALSKAQDDYKKIVDSAGQPSAALTDLKNKKAAKEIELKNAEDALKLEKEKTVQPVVVATPSPSPTVSPTVSPDPTASPSPTGTPQASPSPTVSPSPSPTVLPTPAADSPYQDPVKIQELEDKIQLLKNELNKLISDIAKKEDEEGKASAKAKSEAESDVQSAQKAVDRYKEIKENQPEIKVDMDNAKSWTGKTYKDRVDLQVTIKNGQNLIDSHGNRINVLSVKFKAYDGTYFNSKPIRASTPADHLQGYLNFGISSSGEITRPTVLTTTAGVGTGTDDEESADLAAKCEEYYNMINSQSFGAANWGASFSASTRNSWNFAGDVTTTAKVEYAAADRIWDSDDEDFYVKSIIKNCVIKPGSSFVSGFYTCENLTIMGGRTKPLRIVGTFIIAKSLKIDEQAIRTGITWSSIYYPQATQELRDRGVLYPLSDPGNLKKCDQLPSPIWHPMPSIQETADRMSCNVISLRARANPFQWTAVDPDCGIPVGATQTVPNCKRRLYHYFVIEQAREGQGL